MEGSISPKLGAKCGEQKQTKEALSIELSMHRRANASKCTPFIVVYEHNRVKAWQSH